MMKTGGRANDRGMSLSPDGGDFTCCDAREPRAFDLAAGEAFTSEDQRGGGLHENGAIAIACFRGLRVTPALEKDGFRSSQVLAGNFRRSGEECFDDVLLAGFVVLAAEGGGGVNDDDGGIRVKFRTLGSVMADPRNGRIIRLDSALGDFASRKTGGHREAGLHGDTGKQGRGLQRRFLEQSRALRGWTSEDKILPAEVAAVPGG